MDVKKHLRWSRLDHPTTERRKPQTSFGGPLLPIAVDREEHGNAVSRAYDSAVEHALAERQAHGIDTADLMVLDFGLSTPGQNEEAEHLGFSIVREAGVPAEPERYMVKVRSDHHNQATTIGDSLPPNCGVTDVLSMHGRKGEAAPDRFLLAFDSIETAQRFWDNKNWHSQCGLKEVEKPEQETHCLLTVQAPTPEVLNRFGEELQAYSEQRSEKLAGGRFTVRQRKRFFDALLGIRQSSPAERAGPRLGDDLDFSGLRFLDVDFWYPGHEHMYLWGEVFTAFAEHIGARVTDRPSVVAETMLLARVEVDAAGAKALLASDLVARVELPPTIELRVPISVGWGDLTPDGEPEPDGPLACVVDSGVVSGHPLLSGRIVVEAADFDSGDDDAADLVGHGTHVAGIVVYGDIPDCIATGTWRPKVRLLSAKVMRRSQRPDLQGIFHAAFADEKRVETQLRDVVKRFSDEYGCRVFNLSFGNPEFVMEGQRQLPWACLLDELARKHDVVIVVSTGNVGSPAIPQVDTSDQFQQGVLDNLYTEEHRLIDPASAVNALTVGAISRSDTPSPESNREGERPSPVGGRKNGPAPFTRTGTLDTSGPRGPNRAVKPELVAYGGNLRLALGQHWASNDRRLAEPSLNHAWVANRQIRWDIGTSCAAPYVAHVCALIEHHYRDQEISANMIRALACHSAVVDPEIVDWIRGKPPNTAGEARLLRVVGYGRPVVERALHSTDKRVVLMAEDEIAEDNIHVYQLALPDEFFAGRRRRFIRVTLAYDPPIRGTRLDYMARTMSTKLVRGLSAERIIELLGADLSREYSQGDTRPRLSEEHSQGESRPTETLLEWSTVQSRVFTGEKESVFDRQCEAGATWHVVVEAHKRFDMPDEQPEQRYALVLSLEDEQNTDVDVQLYEAVRQNLEVEVRERIRLGR